MIAYFVFLLCCSCRSDQLIIEKEQEYYLTDQDKINLYGKYVAITSNNSNPNLTEYFQTHQQQLLSEALSFQLDQNYRQIFLVENHDEEFIHICFMFMNNIQCQYRIHNYLLNDKLIVDQEINLTISTNFTKCLDLINYNEGLYLLICIQDNYIKAQIINEKSVIFDSITFSSETNSSISFDYSQNRILFYEIDSIDQPIQIYFISNNQFNLNPLIIKMGNEDQNLGKVKNVIFVAETEFLVTFQYSQILYNYMELSIQTRKLMIRTDFKYLNRNSEFIYGISENQTEPIQLESGILSFSNSFHIPLNVISVENKIILEYEEEIVIMLNRIVNFTINCKSKQVSGINKLPYILVFNQNINFYEIFELPHYISKEKNNYAFSYPSNHFTFIDLTFQRFSLFTYNIQNPAIIIKLHNLKPLIQMDYSKLVLSSDLLSGIPVNFEQCKVNQQKISIQKQIQQLNFNHEGQIKILQINQVIFAIAKLNKFITIQKLDPKGYTTPKKLENIENIDNIYINSPTFSFVYVRNNHVYHYRFWDDLELVKEIHFNIQIQQVKITPRKFLLLLQNCTILEYNFNTYTLSSPQVYVYNSQLFVSDCTKFQYLINTVIMLRKNSIRFFPRSTYSKHFSFSEIIDCDYIDQRLIVYELSQKKIRASVYYFGQQVLKLYELPTYGYLINIPLQKQISYIYLAISAKDLENQQVIMIYKILNPTSSSLRKVIQIDKESNFDFFGAMSTQIYYIYQQKVHIEDIEELEINMKNENNKFVENFKIDCQLQSQISNISGRIEFEIVVINQLFQIQLIDKDYLEVTEANKISLNNLKGIINDLEVEISPKDCIIEKPLTILLTKQLSCKSITNQFCYKLPNLTYDYFGRNQTLIIYDRIEILAIYPNSDYNYTVIFRNLSNTQFSYLSHRNNDEYWKFSEAILLPDQLWNRIIKKIDNLFVIEYEKQNQKLFFLEKEQIHFLSLSNETEFQKIDISKIQKYFIILTQQSGQIEFYLISNHDQKQYKFPEIQKRISVHYIYEVKILNQEIIGQILIIKFCLFLNRNQGYSYALKVNLIDDSYSYEPNQVIRYGLDKLFNQVFYCNFQFLILSLRNNSNNKTLNFYSLDSSKEIIDSYFQIPGDEILSFEQFNETHLTMLHTSAADQGLQLYNLSLVQVGFYKLKCQNNDKNVSLLIKNDVADYKTYVIVRERKSSINMVIIVCFIFKKSNKRNQRKFNVAI